MDKKPIVLIPGIQGTKLTNMNDVDFKTIWSGVKKYFSNIHDLTLQYDGVSDKGAENIIERADVENLAYSEIVNYLRSLGYRVFIFGYDWRKSNMESAKVLKIFVRMIQKKLKEPKINFLTHSMGGLVLQSYFRIINEKEIYRTVNKAIMTVPPFLGSIEATYNLVIGKSRLFNSSDDFRKVAKTFPGLYELLPVYNNAYVFKDNSSFNIFDFDTYWQQESGGKTKLDSKYRIVRKRIAQLEKVRSQDNFIFDFGQLPQEIKEKLVILAGGGERTQTKIDIQKNKRVNGRNFKYYFDFGTYDDEEKNAGDGTVPLFSSLAFKDVIPTFQLDASWLEKRADSRFIMADWHAFFLNNGRVQNVIKRFFDPKFYKNENWYCSSGGDICEF